MGIAFPEDGVCPYCPASKKKEKRYKSNSDVFVFRIHLQTVHPEVVKAHEEALASQTPKQPKLNFPVVSHAAKPTRLLALYAGTTTMPLFHIENRYFRVCANHFAAMSLSAVNCTNAFAHFQELLGRIPKLKIPDRRQLGELVENELKQLQSAVCAYLGSSKYAYSFGVDISTTKGMTLSFLGITAHVWSTDNSTIRTFGLEMVPLEERHTAVYIHKVFQDTLKSLKLSETKTLRIVMDCGRNVLNAF